MNTELFIEDRRVDISASISNLLTFAIDDIKEFASRQTTFSKTIILPGTSNNNLLFGNIFETGISNDYDPLVNNIGYNFNASKSASCVMFQDNLQTFKGSLRLLQINKDKGNIDYEVALNGTVTNLTVSLSSAYLEQLSFSEYNHTLNATNIVNSWDNPGGSGYYYPLIDYGLASTLKQDWNYKTFRPALYAKEYIDKMFAAANYRYECDLFNTTRFKNLIVPHNKKQLRRAAVTIINANGGTQSDSGIGIVELTLGFTTFATSSFNYNAGTKEFTYTDIDAITFNMSIVVNCFFTTGPATLKVYKNGGVIGSSSSFSGSPTFINFYQPVSMVTGDVFKVTIQAYTSVGVTSIAMQLTAPNYTQVPVIIGDTVLIADAIPRNVKQIDFFTSIIKLFNLYVYEDKFDERLIKITPYVDFYSTDSGNAVDWTYKINRNEVIKVKPLSEINSKTYKFNYKDDSDFYNDTYKKRYNQSYGSRIFDSEFEFASAESSLELIFSPTPLVGYASIDKVYSVIVKKNNDVEENIDSNIRLLQAKKITGVSNWKILDGATTLATLSYYGYAGHLDDPDAPTNDLNFGALKELFFTLVTGGLNVNQFNVYWSTYMAEITDKDSKILTAKFHLTPKDIFDLDFSMYVTIDGTLFRLNKIVDYNASEPNDCEVTLLKVINTVY